MTDLLKAAKRTFAYIGTLLFLVPAGLMALFAYSSLEKGAAELAYMARHPSAILFYSFAPERTPVCGHVIKKLRDRFLLSDVIELADSSGYQPEARSYFEARRDRFRFWGSEPRSNSLLDGYIIPGNPSVIGVTLFFFGEQGKLGIVAVTINPAARADASYLLRHSLDAAVDPLDAPLNSPVLELVFGSHSGKLHFLGLHPLDSSRIVKIMLREDDFGRGPTYSVYYAISAEEAAPIWWHLLAPH